MAIKVGEKDLFPYLGDYGPVSIYKGEQKIAGYKWAEKSGQELHFDNTYNSLVEVEVDGKSYQHAEPSPDSPIEIHSLNDFDVVSSVGGKNLFIGEALTHYRQSDNVHWEDFVLTYKRNNSDAYAGAAFKLNVEIGVTYTLSFKSVEGDGDIRILDETGSRITARDFSTGDFSMNFTPAGTLVYILFTDSRAVNDNKIITNIQIEEGSAATDWTPAPEDITEDTNHPLIDKVNLSLSEPLRSVGDIKDRLFRDDSDGLWKVERNIELINPEDGTRTIEETYGVLDSPIYEVLPQDYQDKLNALKSFKGSNYVYTVSQDDGLTPTIHAKTEVKDI